MLKNWYHIIISFILNWGLIGVNLAQTGDTFVFCFNYNIENVTSNTFYPLPGDLFEINYKDSLLTAINSNFQLADGINRVPITLDTGIGVSSYSDSLFSITFYSQQLGCSIRTINKPSLFRADTFYFHEIVFQPALIYFQEKSFCENNPIKIKPIVPDYIKDLHLTSTDLDLAAVSDSLNLENQTPGSYIIVFNSNYCMSDNRDTITINPSPTFEIEKNRKICNNRSIELNPVTDKEANYYWSNGSVTKNIMVTRPGTYSLITQNSFGCTYKDSVKVEFKTIQIEELKFEPLNADCYNTGSINIEQLNVVNAEQPYIYRFVNLLNDQISQDIQNLREGDYMLSIEDAEGCVTTSTQIIKIRKDCLNEYPVFSPNIDGRDDDYFIPYEGEAVVFDRNGIERQRLITPAYWDGKDEDGNQLPMGSYVIIINEKDIINITIVK